MPFYMMDIHKNMKVLTKEALEDTHQKDVQVQGKHGVKFTKYWYNENKRAVFCLCEAPNKEVAVVAHREAHGGVADEVIEVKKGL